MDKQNVVFCICFVGVVFNVGEVLFIWQFNFISNYVGYIYIVFGIFIVRILVWSNVM